METREGHHLFFYPIEGRLVHEGLAALFAYRLAQLGPISFTLAANDYGLELLSADRAPLDEALEAGLLSPSHLLHDIPASLNAAELARRQFREIARVAGLIFTGFPGVPRSVKQLQASSELLYDVFTRYDPDNLLVTQAHREVLERQLEQSRLGRALDRIAGGRTTVVEVERPTPLAFPLLVDRAREQLTSEKLLDRIKRMIDAARTRGGRRDRPLPARRPPRLSQRQRSVTMANTADVHLELAGEPVRLLPERALFWPAACALVVADVHWGKAAAFRAAGIPIPGGATRQDLDRLDQAVARTGARRLIVLGDLFHAKAGRIATRTLAALRRWREARDHAGDPAGARQPRPARRRSARPISGSTASTRRPSCPVRTPAPARAGRAGLYPGGTRAPGDRAGRAGSVPRAAALFRGGGERDRVAGVRQLHRPGDDHTGARGASLRRR